MDMQVSSSTSEIIKSSSDDCSKTRDAPSTRSDTSQTLELSVEMTHPPPRTASHEREEWPPLRSGHNNFLSVPRFQIGADTAQEMKEPGNKGEGEGRLDDKLPKPELDWTLLKEGKLYGRDGEILALQEAFHRQLVPSKDNSSRMNDCGHRGCSKGTPELVLVSGQTGKTVLVKRALQTLVEECDGYFICGKFDQLQTPEPYGPIVAALTHLVIVLEQANFQTMDGLRQQFLKQVGMEACHILCALVPALSRVLDIHQEKTSNNVLSVQQERLKVSLKKFFQVICSREQPLVLAMDDLQWADIGSLDLLETLVTDEIDGLVLVGICRSNEVPWHHTFASMLRRLEDDAGAKIVHIEVKQLPLQATNALLSDMLRQPQQICLPLAEVIHAKSRGNAFFILQILKTLHAEGVLVAERLDGKGPYQWLWHDDQWDSSFHNLDIVELVSYQIKSLPDRCQRLLKTAACIGACFEEQVVAHLLEDICVKEVLMVALEEQMVVQQVHRPGKYSFAHDRIQQAAYSLIPEVEILMVHLTIGRSLLQSFNEEELQDNLFLIVNQLIRGIPLLTTDIDKNGLAELCLQAGKKASRASDFETARQYFNTGTDLLSNRHWRDEYYLSLQLYNCRAEVEFGCGDFDQTEETIREIQLNCRSPTDMQSSNLTRIYSLGARTRFQEAIDVGFHVMESLGERFPSKPRLIYLVAELIKVNRRLKGKSDQDILNLPRMEADDKSTMTAMQVLQSLSLYLFCGNPEYFPFIILRMMKLTLKHGHSEMSAITFASYGMILCAIAEFEEAYRYAKLSLQLLDRDPVARIDWLPRVYFIVYAAISPWKMPLKATFESHRIAIAAGMDNCDFECSVYSAYGFIINFYLSGEPLCKVEALFGQYLDSMKRFNQGPWLSLTFLLRRFVLNLMGKTEDPLALDFGSHNMNASSICKFNFQLLESTLMLHRVILYYHLGNVDKAVASAKALRIAEKATKGVFILLYHYFYDGVAMFEAAYHGQKRQHTKQGCKALKKLEALAKQSPENILHKVYLLRGEVQALKGNLKKALEWYSMASEHAASQGVLQLQALAHERAGIACQRLGKAKHHEEEATVQLRQAVRGYDDWGGVVLVEHLKAKHNL